MDLDDNTRGMLAHLLLAPDAYLLGPLDFRGTFPLRDKATLENRSYLGPQWVTPGEVVQQLENEGHIERFAVADETKIGFRISAKARSQLRPLVEQ